MKYAVIVGLAASQQSCYQTDSLVLGQAVGTKVTDMDKLGTIKYSESQ
jgi:hypothetical protein